MGNIVLIDDDPQYAGLVKHQLTASGHKVICCGSLRAGRQAVATFAPDVVLLDVCLPDGNGLEGIHSFKAAPCAPEIIVITATGDEVGAELAIRSGVWSYWPKDRNIQELVLSIAHAMAYRSERVARQDWRTLDLGGIVGESQPMVTCYEAIAAAAAGDVPVLISGETGSGKEVVARAIHRNGSRASRPLIVVDCASLSESLVESVLFGHDRGAFTGASGDRAGLVRQAHEGTLFLDEIGELPLVVQKSFLRVLQEKRFRSVGSDRESVSDFRLLAATHRNLEEMVRAGSFREDLYFRLRSMEILLPPLRSRKGDIGLIAQTIAVSTCERLALSPKEFSSDFNEALQAYAWPGNVRELRQAVECAVVAAGCSKSLEAIHLPVPIRIQLARALLKSSSQPTPLPLSLAERPTLAAVRDAASTAYLSKLLEDVGGDIEAACAIADISRSRLYGLLKSHRIDRGSHGKASAEDEPLSYEVA